LPKKTTTVTIKEGIMMSKGVKNAQLALILVRNRPHV